MDTQRQSRREHHSLAVVWLRWVLLLEVSSAVEDYIAPGAATLESYSIRVPSPVKHREQMIIFLHQNSPFFNRLRKCHDPDWEP